MTKDYPSDLDVAWLATDTDGHLAVFITAGQGAMPSETLDGSAPSYEDAEEAALRLPRTSRRASSSMSPRPIATSRSRSAGSSSTTRK